LAKGIEYLDEVNKRVYLGVAVGDSTTYTVQEIGSGIKDQLQLSPHIDLDRIFIWSGYEEYQTGTFTGVVMTMQNGWTLWTAPQGSEHRLRITQGIVLDSAGGDPIGMPTNIVWSLSEQSVSALLTATATASSTRRSLDI